MDKGEQLLRPTEINWTHEVSANALKPLQEEQRNTSRMIPLNGKCKSTK